MLNKLKKNDKKGFTLVELIVVLVILAILAALLIPTLTGYIDKAKEKSIIAKTRQAVMAAQTLVDEEYGVLTLNGTDSITIEYTDTGDGAVADKKVTTSEIGKLAEVTPNNIIKVELDTTNKGKVTKLVYSENGMTCTYDSTKGTYEVTKGTATRD